MRLKAWHFAGPMLGVAVGLVAGFKIGQAKGFHQGYDMGMGFLETEVKGGLSVHVEEASCIRVGDMERALKLLDGSIDAAVTSVAAQPGQLGAQAQLSQAKLYRSVIPASETRASAVATALAQVPAMELPPEAGPSRSGLVRLARQSGS
jgi:hypothetical protein